MTPEQIEKYALAWIYLWLLILTVAAFWPYKSPFNTQEIDE